MAAHSGHGSALSARRASPSARRRSRRWTWAAGDELGEARDGNPARLRASGSDRTARATTLVDQGASGLVGKNYFATSIPSTRGRGPTGGAPRLATRASRCPLPGGPCRRRVVRRRNRWGAGGDARGAEGASIGRPVGGACSRLNGPCRLLTSIVSIDYIQ
jgi:hypothetical protein